MQNCIDSRYAEVHNSPIDSTPVHRQGERIGGHHGNGSFKTEGDVMGGGVEASSFDAGDSGGQDTHHSQVVDGLPGWHWGATKA